MLGYTVLPDPVSTLASPFPLSRLTGCDLLRRLLKPGKLPHQRFSRMCWDKMSSQCHTNMAPALKASKLSPGLELRRLTEFLSTTSVLEGAGLLGNGGTMPFPHPHGLFCESASFTSGLSPANSDSGFWAVWAGVHFSPHWPLYSDPEQPAWPKMMPSPTHLRGDANGTHWLHLLPCRYWKLSNGHMKVTTGRARGLALQAEMNKTFCIGRRISTTNNKDCKI